jgi:LuxR family transcriptional regulator, maltose regulon positive regulatory protein
VPRSASRSRQAVRRSSDPPAFASTGQSTLRLARTTVPPRAAGILHRRALEQRLDEAVAHQLTVVSAGPGWGKSTAVAAWAAAQDELPVAWLTLEHHDDAPSVFWQEVLQAVVLSGALPEGHPLADVDPAGAVSVDVLRAVFRGFESLPGPLVLVLDDFHVVEDPAVLESIESLVRYELPVRVVLITRMDPALHLHRLRLDGELAELSATDLAFDADEVRTLAAREGLALTPREVDLLLDRTEGWPAGVRLAMLYLSRGDGHRDLAGFAGDDRSVAEYLLAEVLERQSPETREFLLQTSVVSPVSVELAEAVAPGHPAQARLEELVRGNQFVTALGPDGRWFRYHPLLLEMLRGTARRDHPDAYRQAHGEAARWLAAHDEPVRALRHAAAADDWSLFAALFAEAGAPGLVGPDRGVVQTLLAELPYHDVPPTAATELCAAGLAMARGRFAAVRARVDAARAMEAAVPVDLRGPVGALTEVFDSAAARGTGDLRRAVDAGRAAIRRVDGAPWPFPAMQVYRVAGANSMAVGLLWTGDVHRAREVLTGAMDTSSGVTLSVLNARSHLALCDLVECRVGDAQSAAAEALAMAAPRGWSMHLQLRPAHLVLAMVRVLRGDHDGADLALASALAANVGGEEPSATLLSRLAQIFVAVSRGRLRAAEHALDAAQDAAESWFVGAYLADQLLRAATEVRLLAAAQGEPRVGQADPLDAGHLTEQVCRARSRLSVGDATTAEELAERVTSSPGADKGGELVTTVEAWLVRSLAAHRLRRDNDAMRALGHAVDLARPEAVVRPFLVMAEDKLPSLLRLHESVHGTRDPFTARLLDLVAGSEATAAEPEPLLVPLTDRELAMLAALPSMQSNAEIAAEFFVSVNTVKAHLKALYRKLGVGTRRDAVRRGRELGLLP